MNKYFLHDEQNQLGPFDKSELKERKVTADTPIWHEGLTDWTTAGELPELKELFVIVPPPFKKVETNFDANSKTVPPFTKTQEPKKVETAKKFKLGLFHYLAILGIVLIAIISYFVYSKSQDKIAQAETEAAAANASLAETQQNLEKEKDNLKQAEQERQRVEEEKQKTEQEKQRVIAEQNNPQILRENLLKKEQSSPTTYLRGSGTLQENITQQPDLFHHTEKDGYIIRGYVRNNATLARYKDVVILINYYTKTRTLLGSKEFFIPDYFNPRSTTNFGRQVRGFDSLHTTKYKRI